MRRLGFAYWKDSWNYTMMFSYLLNLFLVTNHVYNYYEMSYRRMITWGAGAAALQWFIFYYWFRLVPSLAFFVTFLVEVLWDISGFVVMFFVCILMFGNANFIISESYFRELKGDYGTDDNPDILDQAFGNRFVDALFTQYQLTIGMGNTDPYGTKIIVWVFYLCTTLFTQITFFNMLISIMGQSFERIDA